MGQCLAAHWRGQEIVRRVVELGFLSPSGELSVLTRPSAQGIPRLDHAGLHALAAWTSVATTEIETDLMHRRQ